MNSFLTKNGIAFFLLAMVAISNVYGNLEVYGRGEFEESAEVLYAEGKSMAILNNSNIVVIWNNNDGMITYNIYGQIFDETGTKVGSRFQVAASGSYTCPAVSALPNNRFVVTWYADGPTYDIYGQIFDANANKIGVTFQVNTSHNTHTSYPVVTSFSDGNFVIVWNSYYSGSSYDIYGRIFNESGEAVSNEFKINTSIYQQQKASIALFDNDDFVVAWDELTDGSDTGIYGQIFNKTGHKVGSKFPVNTYTSDAQQLPAVSTFNNGDFVVVWESDNQDGDELGIYGQIFDRTGTKIGNEFQINTSTTGNQRSPAVTTLNNGYFVVTWSCGTNIYGQVFDKTCSKIGSEFRVNIDTLSNRHYPSIAAFNDGGFVTSWTIGSFGDHDFAAQVFDTFLDVTNKDQTLKYLEDTPVRLDPMSVFFFNPSVNATMTSSDPLAGKLVSGPFDGATSTYNTNLGQWKAWGNFEGINQLLGNLVFVPASNYNKDFSISLLLEDGKHSSITKNVTGTINFLGTPVNVRPLIITTTMDLFYDFKDESKYVDDNIIITRVDNNYLQSAKITMIGNIDPIVDSLRFTDQNGITGHYNSSTGELLLLGKATAEHYQEALRSIKYQYNSTDKIPKSIIVGFVVNDGTYESNIATRKINVGGIGGSGGTSPSSPDNWTLNVFLSTTISAVISGTISVSATCLCFGLIHYMNKHGYLCYKKTESNANLIEMKEED